MATDKLSEGIKRHIDGWELIAEKNRDFNLGDEVVKNLFYDREHSRLNIIFSQNYGDPTSDEVPEQEVLLFQCYGVEDVNCGFMRENDYIQSVCYRDLGDAVQVIIYCAGMSFVTERIVVMRLPWLDAVQKLFDRNKQFY